ncbi:hypothetical protein [Pseudomonas sp. B329]|uniref:hypothetical protein n=1 Tax=Pseudomonas sp. B329 TaxID=1553459 RepID=UPI002004461E|nr:hypothetical protein [Pseudomonas sp. B329]MCK3864747.1 hypothetical protein [Pseudomonas sp. B329]
MSDVKEFLGGMYDIVLFPCWLTIAFFLIRKGKQFAAPLFVWGCSFPITVYCYIVYIFDGGRPWCHWVVVAIDLLAFAQLGWVGALLMIVDYLRRADSLKKLAVWVSGISVVAHGFFLVVGLIFYWLSK